MGFSEQEYWSALPFPSPGYLPVSTMTAISIAIAIPHYPSHRTSRKKEEGELLFSLTREQFEMQEVSELAVVTLLVRYKTVYIKQCIFLQVEREERVERRIQDIRKN